MTTKPHKGNSKHIRRWDARLNARIAGYEQDKKDNSKIAGMANKPGSGRR